MNNAINPCGCSGEASIIKRRCVSPFDTYYMFSLRCQNCMTLSSEYKSEEQAIEAWNTAHPKKENFMQVFEWLEDGKFVRSDEYDRERRNKIYVKMVDGSLFLCEVETNHVLNKDLRVSDILFYDEWQLYEEPKYKEVDGRAALAAKLLDINSVIKLPYGERIGVLELSLCLNRFHLLSEDKKSPLQTNLLNKEILSRTDWRIYEN